MTNKEYKFIVYSCIAEVLEQTAASDATFILYSDEDYKIIEKIIRQEANKYKRKAMRYDNQMGNLR